MLRQLPPRRFAGPRLPTSTSCVFILLCVLGVGAPRTANYHRTAELPALPIVERQTQQLHDAAVLDLQEWLLQNNLDISLARLMDTPCILAQLLVEYGRHLYRTNRPRYWFLMAITALQRFKPDLKQSFKSVWQLNTIWMTVEPSSHRNPTPFVLAKAIAAVGLLTHNPLFAGCVVLSFFGLARIGEVLKATRSGLLLPKDMLFAVADRSFLYYDTPKSRRRGGAVQQHSLIKGEHFAKFLAFIFDSLPPSSTLYPFLPSTFRARWDRVLAFLGVNKVLGFTPGGLRGGGAVHAYMLDTPIPDICWRMRVQSHVTLQHYLQEVAAVVSLKSLPAGAAARVTWPSLARFLMI